MATGIDVIARGLGAKGLQEANRANTRIDALPKGLVYKGAVDYYSDLPATAKIGDTYTVKYQGTSGTKPDGSEYAWGTYDGTKQWIPLGITAYGTVENVSAGEGLSITGDSTVNPTVEVAQGYKLPTESEWNNKTDKILEGTNGIALIFNENDGGGSKFEHKDGTNSFIGVNDGGASGIAGQIYVVNKNNTSEGVKINLEKNRITYIKNKATSARTDADEIAVKGDIGIVETNLTNHIQDTNNPHNITKTQVGLSNVDNTSDLNKPVSTAMQAALDNKTDFVINGTNGKALMFNEADGGGAKFEHKDGTWSGIAVNDGGANGIAAQIYAINKDNTSQGTKINIEKDKITYIKNKATSSRTADDEIAVKGDVALKQDILVNQVNIKSVNNESLLGSGDIEIPTYSPFKSTWNNDTIEQLLTDINADTTATEGKSYLGEVKYVTAAEGLFDGNVEIVVNVMSQITSTNKIIWCIVSSNNVDPYHWEATFSNGSISAKGWTPFVPGTRTIAGIDLKNNITKTALQNALDWSTKQDSLATQTAYTSQGDATHVTQITTNSLGQVTNITEVEIMQPIVNNAALTIKAGGTTKGIFTANASSDVEVNITASDLGLSSALKYMGEAQTTEPLVGAYLQTVIDTINYYVSLANTGNAEEVVSEKGYVIIIGSKEYVCNTAGLHTVNIYQEIGDESSFALKTTQISAGIGLMGGGTLEANRSLSLVDNYGDIKNPYASKTANYVLASPDGNNGVPSFRALEKADIPLSSETATEGGTTTSLVTTGEKYTWNNKSDFSGNYNDLTNKPTIPSIPDCPTNTDGTFILQCVISSGTRTYSWVPYINTGYQYMAVLEPLTVIGLIFDEESAYVGKTPIVYKDMSDGSLVLVDNSELTFSPTLVDGKFSTATTYTITLTGESISTTVTVESV